MFGAHYFVLMQVISLGPTDMKWVANHLGHDVKILEDIYRQQDATIELAKVSKLLIAVENGQIGDFRGKSLNDIQLSGN